MALWDSGNFACINGDPHRHEQIFPAHVSAAPPKERIRRIHDGQIFRWMDRRENSQRDRWMDKNWIAILMHGQMDKRMDWRSDGRLDNQMNRQSFPVKSYNFVFQLNYHYFPKHYIFEGNISIYWFFTDEKPLQKYLRLN